jgi:thiamine transport system ATP-binding protein
MSLDLRRISVSFDGRPVLRDLDLVVPRGSTTAVVGPSGSGKSTLLRVIAGLTTPDAGAVIIDGVDVTRLPPHRRHVGLVFQDNQLFPHLDVWHNVAFGLRMSRTNRAETSRRVAELLALVGLSERAHSDVTVLSGGEAKRVALARALAPRPDVILFDEPLTGLDRELHDHLLVELGRILDEDSTTAVLVTHDRAEADTLASAVVELG